MDLKADSAVIEAAVRKIVVPDQVVELRALQVPSKDGIKRTFSGHFTDMGAFADAAARLSNAGAKGVYFTPNPVRTSDSLGVTNQVSLAKRGSLTKDTDIATVNWLLIDVDPERKAGLSANRA